MPNKLKESEPNLMIRLFKLCWQKKILITKSFKIVF